MTQHLACILAAFVSSTLFLISYLVLPRQRRAPWRSQARGAVRVVYLSILVSHVVLVAMIPPLALVMLTHALRGRLDRHRGIARWTLPVWLYVSVTGVVVYLMLYRL